MHDFIHLIFYLLKGVVGPAVVAAVLGGAAAVLCCKLRKRPISWGKVIAFALLCAWLAAMLSLTLRRMVGIGGIGGGGYNFHLFRAFREAWNKFSLQIWLNPLLNTAMFMPLGVLLPLVWRPFRRWYAALAAGLGLSLAVEAVQYVGALGMADVDDLFCNTLGTMVGWCLCMTALYLVDKKPALAGACAALPVLAAAVLGGTFAAYYLQPYGNLADAPVFDANLSGAAWILDCELPQAGETAGVYYCLGAYDRAACDAFAYGFAQRLGVDTESRPPEYYFDADYYDGTSMYSNHADFFLKVELADRSYEYDSYYGAHQLSDGTGAVYGELSEAELREKLTAFDIDVPDHVTFGYEGDGWHKFEAAGDVKGDTLTTGILRCRVNGAGEIVEIENSLAVCGLAKQEAVLTPEEAYRRLQKGRCSDSEYLEYWAREYARNKIRVTACALEYRADTKGFYQPVYAFGIEDLGFDSVFVPALR